MIPGRQGGAPPLEQVRPPDALRSDSSRCAVFIGEFTPGPRYPTAAQSHPVNAEISAPRLTQGSRPLVAGGVETSAPDEKPWWKSCCTFTAELPRHPFPAELCHCHASNPCTASASPPPWDSGAALIRAVTIAQDGRRSLPLRRGLTAVERPSPYTASRRPAVLRAAVLRGMLGWGAHVGSDPVEPVWRL